MIYALATALIDLSAIITQPSWKTFFSALPNWWWAKICGAALLIWLLVWIENNSLDIDATPVGNKQHGGARWINDKEKTEAYLSVPFGGETVPGMVVGIENKDTWIIDRSDSNLLVLAPPGGGKTKCLLVPTIIYNAKVNKNTGNKGASCVVTDCKGTLYADTAQTLLNCGVKSLLLDFRNPLRSLNFNLMNNINNAIDVYKASRDEDKKLLAYAKAEKYAKILSSSIVENLDTNDKSEASAYFNETAKGLITCLVLLVSEYGSQEQRHIISVFKLVMELNGLEDTSDTDGGLQKSKMEKLLSYVDNHRLINYSGASIKADVRTSMNIFSTAIGKLSSFIDAELEQLVCSHSPELDHMNLIDYPTVIFLVVPDENTTRHFFASLFIRYFSNELIETAESNYHGKLPRDVLFLWDEFGNMPAIKDVDVIFSAIRSRRVRIVIAIQSYTQLTKSYTRDKAKIIRECCQIVLFTYVSPAARDTAEELSKTLGNQTVMTGSVQTGRGTQSTRQMMSKPLLFPDDVITMGFSNFVVMKSGFKAMQTVLPFCTEYLELPKHNISYETKINTISALTTDGVKLKALQENSPLCVGMFD